MINTPLGNGGDTQPIEFIFSDSGRRLRLKWLEDNMFPGVEWRWGEGGTRLPPHHENFHMISKKVSF